MPVIHLCERCIAQYSTSDPLKRFCDDCERSRGEIEHALLVYAKNCLNAWEMRAAQPEAPQFWDGP